MPITIDLPSDIERDLRNRLGDLDAEAKEALAVEFYRQRKLTHHQLSSLLGLSRFETDGVLKKHDVYCDLTAEDVAREAEELRRLRQGS